MPIVHDLDAFVAGGGTVPPPGSTNFDRILTVNGAHVGYRSVSLPSGEVRVTTYWVNP